MDSVALRALSGELATARLLLTLRRSLLEVHMADSADACESARAVCAQAQQVLRRASDARGRRLASRP